MAVAAINKPSKHQSSPKRPGKPGRSNSLQRMLELEKICMIERRHAQEATSTSTSSSSCSSPPPSPQSPRTIDFASTRSRALQHPAAQLGATPRRISAQALPRGRSVDPPSSFLPHPKADMSASVGSHALKTSSKRDAVSAQHRYQYNAELPPQLPPLRINVSLSSNKAPPRGSSSHTTTPGSTVVMTTPTDRVLRTPAPQGSDMGVTTGVGAVPGGNKVAAVPPSATSSVDGRRSVCMSPTWEAYNRQKKDKKDVKEEAKGKKRRLSKVAPVPSQPPPTTTIAPATTAQPTQAKKEINSRPPQTRERSASVTPDSSGDSHRRGRSGSLSSILRAPFEFRRLSSDPTQSSGFIGGIKLEQSRIAAHQKTLEDNVFVADEEVHPALRQSRRRSPSPLKFLPTKGEPKDAQKRFYPPISIRTTSKNQGLYEPAAPAQPEMNKINRWRAKVGLKTKEEKEELKKNHGRRLSKSSGLPMDRLASTASTPAVNVLPSWNAKPEPLTLETRSTSAYVLDLPASSKNRDQDTPVKRTSPLPIFAPRFPFEDAAIQQGEFKNHEFTNSTPVNNDSSLRTPASPPVPRRSSKRRSLVSLRDGPLADLQNLDLLQTRPTFPGQEQRNSLSKLDLEVLAPPSPTSKAAKRLTISFPPSIPYDSLPTDGPANPKRTFKEAAMAKLGRPNPGQGNSPYFSGPKDSKAASTTLIHQEGARPTKSSKPPAAYESRLGRSNRASSSEDSASEDYHSSTSTPDTSRPQSERGMPTTSNDPHDWKFPPARLPTSYSMNMTGPVPPSRDSFQSFTSSVRSVELDPVQAAAMKVMAAFPDVTPPKRPDFERRSNSDPNLTANTAPVLPKLKHQTAKPRDLGKTRMLTSTISYNDDAEDKGPALRDLIMSKDTSSVAAPWPATYLEAARKAAPAAQAPKPNRHTPTTSISSAKGSIVSTIHTQKQQTLEKPDSDPIAKMFVECCSCLFYHDMPSKLYEAMANPEGVLPQTDSLGFAGALSMTVKCPWCQHEMSTKCCAGFAAVVYIKERLH